MRFFGIYVLISKYDHNDYNVSKILKLHWKSHAAQQRLWTYGDKAVLKSFTGSG